MGKYTANSKTILGKDDKYDCKIGNINLNIMWNEQSIWLTAYDYKNDFIN